MKFKTLTSSLALSLLLAGSEAIAMDQEKETGRTLPVNPVTQEEFMRKSSQHMDLVKKLTNSINNKDPNGANQHIEELKQLAKTSTITTETPIPLTPEDKSFLSMAYKYLFGTDEILEEKSAVVSSTTLGVTEMPIISDEEETIFFGVTIVKSFWDWWGSNSTTSNVDPVGPLTAEEKAQ